MTDAIRDAANRDCSGLNFGKGISAGTWRTLGMPNSLRATVQTLMIHRRFKEIRSIFGRESRDRRVVVVVMSVVVLTEVTFEVWSPGDSQDSETLIRNLSAKPN